MHRTQILLRPEQYERLKARAARTRRSIGAIVRDALDAHLQDEPSLDEFLQVLDETSGAWSDRDFADGAEYVRRQRAGMAERLRDSTWT